MTRTIDNKDKKYMVICVLVTFVLHLLRVCTSNVINISLDEIGTLAGAAYCGGCDWSSVLLETRYYGVGFYWIYGILFRFIQNPYHLIVCIYICNSLLISGVSALIYYILVVHLKMKNTWCAVVISVMPGLCYVHANWNYISNDVPAFAVFWLMMFCLLCAYTSKAFTRKQVMYSIFAAGAMGYLLTIHEKTIAVWIAVIVSILFFQILFGERVVHLRAFIVGAIASYVVARWIKNNAIALFWTQAGGNLANTSAFSQATTWLWDKPLGWKIMIDIVITNFLTLCERTGGLIAIALVICIVMVVGGFIYRIQNRKYIRLLESNKVGCLMIFISFFTTAIIVLGLANQWSPSIYRAYYMDDVIGKSIRAYSYERYYIAFVGPAVAAVGAKIKVLVLKYKKLIVGALMSLLVMYGYYIWGIHPYIVDKWDSSSIAIVSIFSEMRKNWNIYISIILGCAFLLLLLLIREQKKLKIYFAACAALIALMNINIYKISMPSVKATIADSGYELVTRMRAEGYEIDEIYAEANGSVYQFMLNREHILYGFPQPEIEECIVFSNIPWDGLHPYSVGKYGFYYTKLDNNEYLYVKGEKNLKILEQMGYVLATDTVVDFSENIIVKGNDKKTYTIFDGGINLKKGTYKVTAITEILSEEYRDNYGYMDVVDIDNVYLNRVEINDYMLNEQKVAELEFIISSDTDMEDVLFRYYAGDGVEMRIQQINIEQVNEYYDIGADNQRAILAVAHNLEMYNDRYGYFKVYFMDDGYKGDENNTIMLLESTLSYNDVERITYDEFELMEKDMPMYVLTYTKSDVNSRLDWNRGYKAIESFIEHTIYLYEPEK